MTETMIFTELKIIKNQLITLTYMIALKEAHEMGIYDDETYKEMIQKALEELDGLVAKTY